MKRKKPAPVLAANVLIGIIAVFVLALLVGIAMGWFKEESAVILYVLLALIAVGVLALILLCVSKGFKNAVKQQEEDAENEIKADAEKLGEIYCTDEQLQQAYGMLDGTRREGSCPICGTLLTYDDEWEYTANVKVNEKVEGLYVKNNYSNKVEPAYQVVEKACTFPATVCRCSACKWQLRRAEYVTYETRKINGEKINYDEDVPAGLMETKDWKLPAKQFLSGNLYGKARLKETTPARGKFRKKQ